MKKALKLLKILRDDYIHGELDKDINEAINELEELIKPKTCGGCKYDYDIDNFDSIDGKRLDSFRPNECYICSRNCNDKFEPKDNA